MVEISWPEATGEVLDFDDLPVGEFFRDTSDTGYAPYGYKANENTILWFQKDQISLMEFETPGQTRGVFSECIPIPNMQITLKEN